MGAPPPASDALDVVTIHHTLIVVHKGIFRIFARLGANLFKYILGPFHFKMYSPNTQRRPNHYFLEYL